MYEYISGKISELTPTYAVVEANSVGYMVHITLNSYSALEGKAEAKLYIEEIIREDAFILYGFSDTAERVLFRQLMSVSGVGANTASVILSSFSVPELQTVIANGDVNSIKKVKGIGLKTAQLAFRGPQRGYYGPFHVGLHGCRLGGSHRQGFGGAARPAVEQAGERGPQVEQVTLPLSLGLEYNKIIISHVLLSWCCCFCLPR